MTSLIAALVLVLATGQVQALEHVKIISAVTCPTLYAGYWYVPANFGTTPTGAGNYLANATGGTESAGTLPLYCDARLPAEATAFDFAELEYFAPDEAGNTAPTLAAYLDARGLNVNGYSYSQTVALGSCTGPLTPLYSGTNPLSVCSTSRRQTFDLDGGAYPGYWPEQGWGLLSVHFLIFIPVSPDLALPNLVYRVVIHYEAP